MPSFNELNTLEEFLIKTTELANINSSIYIQHN